MASLSIPAASRAVHDLLALGTLVIRLDPEIIPFIDASFYALHVSGGEYNVAANLSTCFGDCGPPLPTLWWLSHRKRIEYAVQRAEGDPYYQRFAFDGVRGLNMATVWSDRAQRVRAPPPVVFYNRSNDVAGKLKSGSFDWKSIFARGNPLVPFCVYETE